MNEVVYQTMTALIRWEWLNVQKPGLNSTGYVGYDDGDEII